MTVTQKKFDRELLAIFEAVKHFRHFLEGKNFTIFTDHKPLTFAMNSLTEKSPRQTRQLSFISEFTTDIKHVSGEANVVADMLSRNINALETTKLVTGLNYSELAEAQRNSTKFQEFLNSESSLVVQSVPFESTSIFCDVSLGYPRPVVPPQLTQKVFEIFHTLHHGGVKPTVRNISRCFVWPGMKSEIAKLCKTCHECQASKVHRHTITPLTMRPLPSRRFGCLHVDLVGPLPCSNGFSYLFTIIDRFTRWPEAIPLKDISALSCAKALLNHWISRFGIPDDIISDQGAQFTSDLWKELNKILGIQARQTTAYHPQANGCIERFHRQLKASLRARLQDTNWTDHLAIVLLGIRSSWREDLKCSAADLVYGTSLRLPGQFFPAEKQVEDKVLPQFLTDLQVQMRKVLPTPTAHHTIPKSYVPQSLINATHVYLRHDSSRTPLAKPYDGPFPVVEMFPKYAIILKNGVECKVSLDRTKPAFVRPQAETKTKSKEKLDSENKYEEETKGQNIGTQSRSGRNVRPPRKLNL